MRRFPVVTTRSLVAVLAALSFVTADPVRADVVIAIGDSLTAEYDTVPPVVGFPVEATAYADVTIDGYVSRSWVEILARLRPQDFEFGFSRKLSDPWPAPRLSGYELNWGVPGIKAGQAEDFISGSNALYAVLRRPLVRQLQNRAERVVIWLGTNDFRANYGFLYDGGARGPLINGLIDDLTRIVDFVQEQNPDLQIVLGNIPDLGATPSRREAHPDEEKRALVTEAVLAANNRIAELAADKGIFVADVYEETARIIRNEPTFFGGVRIRRGLDDDNDPHFDFTRDGLHPNTPLQIRIAKTFIRAFNQNYGAGIRQIDDGEALRLLGINPNEPYFEWAKSFNLVKKGYKQDEDGDKIVNLAEYAFGLDPGVPDAGQLPVALTGPVPDRGDHSLSYTPNPERVRHLEFIAQYSVDGGAWKTVSPGNTINNGGTFTAVVPPTPGVITMRLKVRTRVYPGSLSTFAIVIVPE